ADRNLQTPPAITTDHRRRLTRFAEKRPTGATSPLQAAKTSSPCIKAASRAVALLLDALQFRCVGARESTFFGASLLLAFASGKNIEMK
ncbi:hypothetical protein NKI95_32670, partial [Mesorhizobium sp. M0306]|uniref:hypothetical protein n=1 Tax=Mesorhizobium sp. M0306 TaxID=2956932 RepID=UPI003335D5CD